MKTLLHRYLVFLAAATFLLIVAGGLVTSTESGLSVPDWPLSYGSLFPPMVGGIRFEHTHRLIAGTIGLLTLLLTVLAWKFDKRSWIRGLSLAALVLVVIQAVLGGLTVIYLLPTWISVSHACMGQTFFCLIAALAFFTSREWRDPVQPPAKVSGHIFRLFAITTVFVYLQLIAGAIVRHTPGHGINFHIILGVLVAMHVMFMLFRCAFHTELRDAFLLHSLFFTLLVLTQVMLGLGAFMTTLVMAKAPSPRVIEVLLTAAHQANGALVLAASLLITIRAGRYHFSASGA